MCFLLTSCNEVIQYLRRPNRPPGFLAGFTGPDDSSGLVLSFAGVLNRFLPKEYDRNLRQFQYIHSIILVANVPFQLSYFSQTIRHTFGFRIPFQNVFF